MCGCLARLFERVCFPEMATQSTGFVLSAIVLASIVGAVAAGRTCDVVSDCGAISDNRTLATDAINACIQTCCLTPGCKLVFPPSSAFLITSLDVSNTTGLTFEFGANASLSASTNASLYPIAPFYPRMGNTTCYRAVVFGRFVRDLTVVERGY